MDVGREDLKIHIETVEKFFLGAWLFFFLLLFIKQINLFFSLTHGACLTCYFFGLSSKANFNDHN